MGSSVFGFWLGFRSVIDFDLGAIGKTRHGDRLRWVLPRYDEPRPRRALEADIDGRVEAMVHHHLLERADDEVERLSADVSVSDTNAE